MPQGAAAWNQLLADGCRRGSRWLVSLLERVYVTTELARGDE
jgi:hypothetical protein